MEHVFNSARIILGIRQYWITPSSARNAPMLQTTDKTLTFANKSLTQPQSPSVVEGKPGELLLRTHSTRTSCKNTRRSGSLPVTPTQRSGSNRCNTQSGDQMALGMSSGSAIGLTRQVSM